jgi:hypothetical protein
MMLVPAVMRAAVIVAGVTRADAAGDSGAADDGGKTGDKKSFGGAVHFWCAS